MNKSILIITFISGISLLSNFAKAQENTTTAPTTTAEQPKDGKFLQNTDKREENMQKRIDQGVQSGRLNEQEANRLQNKLDHIKSKEEELRKDKAEAMSDGKIDRGERAELRHDRNQIRKGMRQENKAIFRKKHNGRNR